MELLADPQAWLSFITLAVLEIVLGIDNIIFLSILVGKLPQEQQHRARILGLGLAMVTRIGLLFSITWLMSLTADLFTLPAQLSGQGISGRDLILAGGGLFLLGGETLRGFSAALIVGIVVGTYSSIFVAAGVSLDLGLTQEDLMPSAKTKEVDELP